MMCTTDSNPFKHALSYHSDLPLSSPTFTFIDDDTRLLNCGIKPNATSSKPTRISAILERINTTRWNKDKTKYEKPINLDDIGCDQEHKTTTQFNGELPASQTDNETSQFAVVLIHSRNYGTFPSHDSEPFLTEENNIIKPTIKSAEFHQVQKNHRKHMSNMNPYCP